LIRIPIGGGNVVVEGKSFVKACQEFFSTPPFGRKVEISEFKELSTQDKLELSEMLNAAGHTHKPYTGENAQ
jgi:hypothetical protein